MTKYSVKLILWEHNTNAKNQHPIYLQITIDRKTSYIATGYHVIKKLWDSVNEIVKSSHSSASLINADITDRKHKITRLIVDKNLKNEPITAAQVKELFAGGKDKHNYFDFVDSFKSEMGGKRKGGTLENYRKHSLKLEKFHGSRALSFEDIDHDFLVRYEQQLLKDVGQNYTHKLLTGVRTIIKAAIRRKIITDNPFDTYEIPKYSAPDKDYLTLEELTKVEEVADNETDESIKQTAIYFLLGCYTGLRISDWYTFSVKKNIRDGRVYLRTKKNNEWVTMQVVGRFKKHIKRLAGTPLTIEEPTINEKLKIIATRIETGKYLTSHSGRHTFAITMCADQGISSETCAELMGITIATCVENYYKVTNRKIDKETLAAWENI